MMRMRRGQFGNMPHVIVVGAGFGGLQAVKSLRNAPVRVTVVDRRNYHLFQPFLYQVATSTLSGSDIAVSIRHELRKQRNARVLMEEVKEINRQTKQVILSNGRTLPFDYLILATGSRQSYFGNEEWESFAPGLKSISDAHRIRNRILGAFEKAEMETDPERQKRLMTVVLVGGGPTGVELAGAIAYLAKGERRADYKYIDPASLRIVLLDRGSRLLKAFPESLSFKAKQELEKSNVMVRLDAAVDKIDFEGVHVGSEVIPAETILWTAGVSAFPPGEWSGDEKDRSGRIRVAPDLSVPGAPDLFVIGDAAHLLINGKPVPGLAPAAMQQGRYVAKLIQKRVANGGSRVGFPPFRYIDKGNLATLGKVRGVADFKGLNLSGFPAWLVWAIVHIFYLVGFRNRFVVMLKWGFLFSLSKTRDDLIVKGERPAPRTMQPPGDQESREERRAA